MSHLSRLMNFQSQKPLKMNSNKNIFKRISKIIEKETILPQIMTRNFNNSLKKFTCSNKLNVAETVAGSNLRQYRSNLRKSNLLYDQIIIFFP